MPKRSDDDRPAPGEAFRRFEDFTRRLLRVPKKAIDRRLAEERTAREKRRRERVKGDAAGLPSKSRPRNP